MDYAGGKVESLIKALDNYFHPELVTIHHLTNDIPCMFPRHKTYFYLTT